MPPPNTSHCHLPSTQVLDEADRLLEPSFESELGRVLGPLPADRQTLLFSATMTRTLVALQSALLRDAYHFQAYEGLQTAAKLREEYLLVPAKVGLARWFGGLGMPSLGGAGGGGEAAGGAPAGVGQGERVWG